MSYRDDLDALAARHAALEIEIAQKERELAAVAALLADARRVDRAATHFETAPLRRRRSERRILAAALGVGLACSAAVGYGSTRDTDVLPHTHISISELTGHISAALAQVDREYAVREAHRVIRRTSIRDTTAKACPQAGSLRDLASKHER